jgi:hypothetical protein
MIGIFTRRAFLRKAPAAVAATVLPISAVADEPELPVTRVNRIAAELAHALNDYADGTMHAVIHPSEKREFCIGFVVTDLHIPPKLALRNQMELTKEAMAAAYPDKDIHMGFTLDERDGHGTLVFATM